jgi:hypothetical protein
VKEKSIDTLLELITAAVQFKFASDPSAPGVLVSKIRNGNIYVSVLRFMSPFGKDKEVAYKAEEKSLLLALESVALQIVAQDRLYRNPMDDLREYVLPELSPLNKGKMRQMWDIVEDNIKNGVK